MFVDYCALLYNKICLIIYSVLSLVHVRACVRVESNLEPGFSVGLVSWSLPVVLMLLEMQ